MAPGRSLRDVELRVVFAVCIFTGLRDGARAQDEGQWPPKGGELPPVSLGCASSLFEPLKGVCGFSGSELMSLIVSLQANDSELRPKYPKEACGFECNQAVLFIIRSNEACVKVNEWLPVGTHDLRDIMGKNFGKACDEHENGAHEIEAANQIMVQNPVNNHDAQNTAVPVGKGVAPAEQAPYGDGAQLYVSEESAAAQHAIDKPAQETGIKELARDNQCVEALTICQLQFPQLLSLQAGELYNDFLWEYWSCPDSCNSTLVGLLSTRRCARVLASKSKVQGSLQLGLTIQSDVELEDSASSLLSVLSGNRGLTYICSRTINPGDGQV